MGKKTTSGSSGTSGWRGGAAATAARIQQLHTHPGKAFDGPEPGGNSSHGSDPGQGTRGRQRRAQLGIAPAWVRDTGPKRPGGHGTLLGHCGPCPGRSSLWQSRGQGAACAEGTLRGCECPGHRLPGAAGAAGAPCPSARVALGLSLRARPQWCWPQKMGATPPWAWGAEIPAGRAGTVSLPSPGTQQSGWSPVGSIPASAPCSERSPGRAPGARSRSHGCWEGGGGEAICCEEKPFPAARAVLLNPLQNVLMQPRFPGGTEREAGRGDGCSAATQTSPAVGSLKDKRKQGGTNTAMTQPPLRIRGLGCRGGGLCPGHRAEHQPPPILGHRPRHRLMEKLLWEQGEPRPAPRAAAGAALRGTMTAGPQPGSLSPCPKQQLLWL